MFLRFLCSASGALFTMFLYTMKWIGISPEHYFAQWTKSDAGSVMLPIDSSTSVPYKCSAGVSRSSCALHDLIMTSFELTSPRRRNQTSPILSQTLFPLIDPLAFSALLAPLTAKIDRKLIVLTARWYHRLNLTKLFKDWPLLSFYG